VNLNRYCNNLSFHFQSQASSILVSSGIVSLSCLLNPLCHSLTSMYCLWCWWLSLSRVTLSRLLMVVVALTQHTRCNGLQNHSHPSLIPCNLISGPETRRLPIMPEPVYGPTLPPPKHNPPPCIEVTRNYAKC